MCFRKTCTTFVENMYVFFQKYNHVFKDADDQRFAYLCYSYVYCLDLLFECIIYFLFFNVYVIGNTLQLCQMKLTSSVK